MIFVDLNGCTIVHGQEIILNNENQTDCSTYNDSLKLEKGIVDFIPHSFKQRNVLLILYDKYILHLICGL